MEIAVITGFGRRGGYGFLHVLDRHGIETGEELFFQKRRAVYPTLGEGLVVRVGRRPEYGDNRPRRPRLGDLLVIERGDPQPPPLRDMVEFWTYKSQADAEAARLKTAELPWRLVRRFRNAHTDCPMSGLGECVSTPARGSAGAGRPLLRRMLRQGAAHLESIRSLDVDALTVALPDDWDACYGPEGCQLAIEVQAGDGVWAVDTWIEPGPMTV